MKTITNEEARELRSKLFKKSYELYGGIKKDSLKESANLIASEHGFSNGDELFSAIARINGAKQVKAKIVPHHKITCHLSDEQLVAKSRPLYKEYKEKFSVSLLQRKFGIGYNRAARVYEKFVARGVPNLRATSGAGKKADASLIGRYRKLCLTNETIPSDKMLSAVIDADERMFIDCRKALSLEGFTFDLLTNGDFRISSRPRFSSWNEAAAAVMAMPHEKFWKMIQIASSNNLI